eukprot:CAMPEP_0114541634 /NCGR_PEP_ID=MMETSP0114-20121206/1408_1 /TAXON_ID=31324 /ORGANISM="Goniomonas sp, Strain m" /LENGTH=59 /DNA_ID=CAMNT_0001725881 /DNA_START=598 /DNA_END=777 /DNA_ORIENTATION=+
MPKAPAMAPAIAMTSGLLRRAAPLSLPPLSPPWEPWPPGGSGGDGGGGVGGDGGVAADE